MRHLWHWGKERGRREGSRTGRRRRPGAGGDARHRPAQRGARGRPRRRRLRRRRRVPRVPARPGAPRRHAPGHRRHGGVPPDPRRVRRADRHAHRARPTPSTSSSGWSRAPTTTSSSRSSRRSSSPASAPGCAAATSPSPSGSPSATSRSTWPATRSSATASARPDAARVRPARRARPQAVAGLHPRGAPRAGLGLPPRRRHPAGQRPRAAAALEDRARPRAPRDRRDRARRRLQGGPGLSVSGSRRPRCADRAGVRSGPGSAGGLADASTRRSRDGRDVRRAPLAPVPAAPRRHHDDAARPVRGRRSSAACSTSRSPSGLESDRVSDRRVRVAEPDHPGAEPLGQLDVDLGRRARPGGPATSCRASSPSRARSPAATSCMNRSDGNDSDVVLGQPDQRRPRHRVREPTSCRRPSRHPRAPADADERGRPSTGETLPAVIVGSVVEVPNAGAYDLYFIYPMEQEVATMGLIGSSFVIAGIILTLLVGAVAWVVTRQVVDPVRRAGEVAQRLSRGQAQRADADPRRGRPRPPRRRRSTAWPPASSSRSASSRGSRAVQQRFVSDVSHELRTPLTTIRMAVDLIHESREDFEPTVARSAELLAGELDRFEALLADLLEISRFDAGAAALDVEPVDLRGTVAKVVDAARPLAERRGSTSPCTRPTSRPRPRSTAPGRADPAQPRRQRHRARRGPAGRHPRRPSATTPSRWSSGPRRRPAPGRGGHRLHPLLARRPGPGPHDRRHRPGPVDLARGRPAARRLAPGLGRARRGLAVPAHPAAARGRHPARVAAAAQPDGGPVSGRRARAALVLLAVLLLAGCGGLSHGGPVEPGLEVGSGNAPVLRVLFPGPAAGVGQDEHRARLRAGRRGERRRLRQRQGLPHRADERAVEPRHAPRAARRRRRAQGDAARPGDGAHHRSRGRHGRPRRGATPRPVAGSTVTATFGLLDRGR